MKKILSILMMMCLMIGSMSTQVFAKTTNEDVRAVWISTVHNLDYPSVKNNEAAQKSEFIQKLDELQAIGINTVVVQIRPKGDALYQSSINPWSDVLTGTQGKYPGYDPMAFMIEEAHKRGMAFHAWLNPYRVTTAGTDVNVLSSDHPARLNPSWTISYKDALYYNPELPEVKAHIVDTVEEIVTNYDVDAIHFDDYFYPSNYPLPTGEGKDGDVANSRREHINEMIRQVSEVIKKVDQTVMFGISPMGIWKNDLSDITGSSTGGSESYYTVAADTRTWIQNEWIDYVVPQIYWETGHKLADYETLVSWWSSEVEGTKVKLYIGQGI
ncbi:MAG: family 10 glycosylhydrolase, partial [Cellulosilyticaceae bacterium]